MQNQGTPTPVSSETPSDPSSAEEGSKEDSKAGVFLVDDHPSVRRALRETIEGAEEMTPCGEASSSGKALRQIEKTGPEVAIVDISLEDAHGFGLLENLEARTSETETVIYSMYEEEVYAERAVRAGASGYLHKSEPPEKIQEAIRTVLRGEVYLSRRLQTKLLNKVVERTGKEEPTPERPTKRLTDRELMVFQMIGLGYSIREISKRLSLASKTIETYRRRAKEKLGCNSIRGLYKNAVRWTYGRGTHRLSGNRQAFDH